MERSTVYEDTLAASMFEDEEDNHRSVGLNFEAFGNNNLITDPKQPRKNVATQVVESQAQDFGLIKITEQEVGLSWLPLVGPVLALLESISIFLQDNQIAYSNARPSEFAGYLFKDTSYAFFQIVVYLRAEDGTPALKITRLTGDAFLTAEMFTGLREYLISQELVCEENDPWNKDIDDFEYLDGSLSDDEDNNMEEEPTMELSKYLQLKYDTNMIDFWVHDMLENEYYDQKLNTMMMLAHNSENLENVQLMLEHSDGKLFEGITKVMEDSSKSFPMMRSCAKTVQNIMCNSEANVSWDLVKTMCDALLFWSKDSESKQFSYNQPIRNSPEIQTTLASSLNSFVQKFNGGVNASEVPEYMKESIEDVQMFLKNERSICAPEARENLEYFVESAPLILGY
jgi:hypothetical protein